MQPVLRYCTYIRARSAFADACCCVHASVQAAKASNEFDTEDLAELVNSVFDDEVLGSNLLGDVASRSAVSGGRRRLVMNSDGSWLESETGASMGCDGGWFQDAFGVWHEEGAAEVMGSGECGDISSSVQLLTGNDGDLAIGSVGGSGDGSGSGGGIVCGKRQRATNLKECPCGKSALSTGNIQWSNLQDELKSCISVAAPLGGRPKPAAMQAALCDAGVHARKKAVDAMLGWSKWPWAKRVASQ